MQLGATAVAPWQTAAAGGGAGSLLALAAVQAWEVLRFGPAPPRFTHIAHELAPAEPSAEEQWEASSGRRGASPACPAPPTCPTVPPGALELVRGLLRRVADLDDSALLGVVAAFCSAAAGWVSRLLVALRRGDRLARLQGHLLQ